MTFSRTLICLALVAVSGLSLYAKTEIAKFQWERRYHGPKSDSIEQPAAVGMDAAGNVFVTGTSYGESSAEDFYTAKYAAADGSLLWEKRYNGTRYLTDIPYALAVTSEGDVVVAGASLGEHYPGTDWFIIKYSGTDGTVLWEQRLVRANTYSGEAKAIAIDSSGDLLVTGTLSENPYSGILTLKCSGSTGAVLWQTRTGGTDGVADGATSVVVDSQGNAVVSGYLKRPENNTVAYDFYAAKYAGINGEVLWEKTIENGYAYTAGVDAAGNAIVSGYQGSSAYTVKLAASNGALLWERRYLGLLGTAWIESLKVDSNGNVYVAGNEIVVASPNPNLPGTRVRYFAKYSGESGLPLWTTPPATPEDMSGSGRAVVLDGDDNPIFAGTHYGDEKILVTKYRKSDGRRVWEKLYDGLSGSLNYMTNQGQLAISADGSVAVGATSRLNNIYDFTTLKYRTIKLEAPVTGPALDVTATGARLTGTATSAGFAGQTMFFKLQGPGVTEALQASKELTGAEGVEVPHSGEITGLRTHSKYTYRIVAEIDGEYVDGEDAEFTTLNIAPEAKDDTFTRPENSGILFFDVLGNDSSVDGDTLTITSVSEPAYGTATIQNGIIYYRPTVDHEGADTFTYTVSDGFGGTSSATVRVGLSRTVAATKIGSDDVKVVVPGTDKLVSILRFGVPTIGGEGSARFVAQVRGAMAIMNQQLGRVVSTWDAVPGVANAKFTSFRDPLLNEAGSTAFIARLQNKGGARTGIFTDSFSGPEVRALAPMALSGTQATGVNGARWSNFVSLGLLDSGAVPFIATLAHGAGGVNASNDLGLWFGTAEGITLLLREGQRLEVAGTERKVRTFAALTAVSDSPGHGRLASAAVPVRVAFTDGNSALVSAAPAGLDLRALTGESAPGVANATFTDFGTPTLNQSGAIAFAATLKAGSVRTSGIFADTHEGTLQKVALQKDAAPDVAGAQFSAFRDPVYNAEYSVAFLATLTGSEITQANATGIWWNGSGDLHLVARTGDPAPGVQDAVFSKFISLALPDGELSGPVFVAEVTSNSEKPKSRKTKSVGLWTLDSTGNVRLIVKEGDVVSGKTITKLTSLNAVAGSPAQRRSYNDNSQIVYFATLDDGSQSIIKVPLP